MIKLFIRLICFLVFASFVRAASPTELALKRPGSSGRLLHPDNFNHFTVVGQGVCRDKQAKDAAHRLFSGIDLEWVETWCQTHTCAGFAFLDAQKQAIVYTQFGCTTNCQVDAWMKNPSLITKTENDDSLGVWKDAVCYRMSENGMQALALRRNLLGPPLVALVETALALGNVLRAVRLSLTLVRPSILVRTAAQAFMTGFMVTLGFEEASMAYYKMDMSDLENQKQALNRAAIGGAISVAAEAVWAVPWLARASSARQGLRLNQRQQGYLWRKYGLRAANPLGQRTVYGLDADSDAFKQAARTWYEKNPAQLVQEGGTFFGSAEIDAARNPGWYYNLALKTALKDQKMRKALSQMADWAWYNFAPTVGISLGIGLAVDAMHDWSQHEEIFLEWIPKKISQAASTNGDKPPEQGRGRRFLYKAHWKEHRAETDEEPELTPEGPELTPEMEQALMENDEERRPLSFDAQENMDKVNFLHSITEDDFNRLALSQTPEGRNVDCSDISDVEGKDCQWMYDVAYNAQCSHDRYTAFQKAISESTQEMQRPSCEDDSPWISGEALEVSPLKSDFITCSHFGAHESQHTWIIPITSLYDEIVFNFCPDESEQTEFENVCYDGKVFVGPQINYVLESMDGTVQATCGSKNMPKDHMLEVDCGPNGEFMKIKVQEIMKWSLLTSPTKEEISASDLPEGMTPFAFNALTFRLTVQPDSLENKRYHFRQTCVEDPAYFNFFSTIMTDTYERCLNEDFPKEDQMRNVCWPDDAAEHKCQFCLMLGYDHDESTEYGVVDGKTWTMNEHIADCRDRGYEISPCLGATVQPKLDSEIICSCTNPGEGRIYKNGFTCDDEQHWCDETEICWKHNPFKKVNIQAESPCSTSQCYRNDRVPGSHEWLLSCSLYHSTACEDPLGLNKGCCCNDGYKVGIGSRGTKECVKCGKNE